MVEKGRQKARMAVAQWGCGLPVVFALVVLCPAGSEHNVPHALALRSLYDRLKQRVIFLREAWQGRRKVAAVKLWGWCCAGWFCEPTCCVSYAWLCQRLPAVTNLCSRNCPSALVFFLWSFLWCYCWQTTACRGGVSKDLGVVLAG